MAGAAADVRSAGTPLLDETALSYYARLLGLLALALVLRVIFFNGAFGSDDGTYYKSALDIAHGQWNVAHYNGALRYGFNLPAAAFIYVFGPSYAVANLWPLCCSLFEIAGVYWFAHSAIGRRAAWIAALLLACTPLHVAVATRIHADPIVSAALTLGFVFIYQGMRRDSAFLLGVAGVAIGMVFWAKELAAVCYLAFLPLLWFYAGQWRKIGIVIGTTLVMFALNGGLMYAIAGDPLHAVKVVLHAVQHNFIEGGDGGSNEAWFYLPLMFADIRHVGLLAWLALLALLLWRDGAGVRSAKAFVVIWWLGVLLVLSCFPVSLSPLRLTLKQSNYITLFLAPMAILGGALLAQWPRRRAALVLAAVAAIGVLLAALQQADYRAFVANSKAVAELASANPAMVVLGSTNNSSLSTMLANQRGGKSRVLSWTETQRTPALLTAELAPSDDLLGVFDAQTASWAPGGAKLAKAPSCWVFMRAIAPQDLGFGNDVAASMWAISQALPTKLATKLGPRLQALAAPAPALLYRLRKGDPWCTH